jgi:2-polyprenyl-6-methoxyphenol hydroxylase-like FAD-dependent oxidoreductase
MMLGYLLARAGASVTVLEKHADFLRDFRGDTVHPSTLEVLDEIGLLQRFNQLPQQRVHQLGARIGGEFRHVIDFRGLKPFDYLALVPQWDFLNLLADEGRQFPHFDLRMRHEVVGLIQDQGAVTGVTVNSPEGEYALTADLVVACDGRHSTVRREAGLHATDCGAPMDVLWFKLPRTGNEPDDTFATFGAGHILVLLNRGDYWQAAFVVAKGGAEGFRAQPIEILRESVARMAPFLAAGVAALDSWDNVRTLEVQVDRLDRWHQPGLLLIGDAAHAMSPIGGVGINLAIQDAVAAANLLADPLREGGPIEESLLHRVQKRRLRPTKLTQGVQLQIQNHVIAKALDPAHDELEMPKFMRWLIEFQTVRNIPARIIGYGFRREHVHTGEHPPATH